MNNTSAFFMPGILKKNISAILLDLIAVAFIYFIPTFSHLLNYPLYLIEPMRIMVVLALIHTNRRNAILLAITLPLVSYLFSAHPMLIKSGLISIELLINVVLFYVLSKKMHLIIAIFSSIWLSKGIYYGLKYITILWLFPNDKLISTPLHIQLITSLVLSVYLFVSFSILNKNKH